MSEEKIKLSPSSMILTSIAFSTPGDVKVITEITPLPTVLVLWNTWVHVGTLNSSNITFYVKTTVDNVLSCRTTLGIPDVHPNYYLIGFRRHFNDTRF